MEVQKEPEQSREEIEIPKQEIPLGGRIRFFVDKLTKSKEILQCVTGCRLNLTSIPKQDKKTV